MFCEALKRFDMGLEDRMATKIGLLSGGQRQVVTLLMSTIVTPKLLLLDEHTAALDPATAEKVMAITNDIVHERNLTTLMITHNMGQALTTGSRTIMLDSGAIIFDIKEEERKHMTVSDLLDMYSEKKKEEFTPDVIEAGKVTVKGLDANTIYWLEETEAPAGYNKLASRVRVEIEEANLTTTMTGDTWATGNGGVQITNQAGTELPSTGGMGTTIFYVLGSILAVGAIVLLVTKKRMSASDK